MVFRTNFYKLQFEISLSKNVSDYNTDDWISNQYTIMRFNWQSLMIDFNDMSTCLRLFNVREICIFIFTLLLQFNSMYTYDIKKKNSSEM